MKVFLRLGLAAFLSLVLLVLLGGYYLHRHIPPELLPDLRAAIAARHVQGAANRLNQYLANRYGSLDDPAHREKAFEDFFNPDHIKAMQLIVKHSPADQRLANIQATADWIQNYRQTMSSQEKSDLQAYFNSGNGQASLQMATAQFMTQDPEYRSTVVPVIEQLMTTLASVRQ